MTDALKPLTFRTARDLRIELRAMEAGRTVEQQQAQPLEVARRHVFDVAELAGCVVLGMAVVSGVAVYRAAQEVPNVINQLQEARIKQ
jgi:hypothetical protein